MTNTTTEVKKNDLVRRKLSKMDKEELIDLVIKQQMVMDMIKHEHKRRDNFVMGKLRQMERKEKMEKRIEKIENKMIAENYKGNKK